MGASKEEVKEPECVDPALVAPSEARYKRNKTNNNKNDAKKATTQTLILVKKFVREKFNAVALQLIENNTGTKKEKFNIETRIEAAIKSLIPNLKFTTRHRLDEDSHPADWLRAFIPEHMKKGDSRSVCISKWCQYTNMKAQLDFAGNEKVGGL